MSSYIVQQYQGLTANSINQTGVLGVVDKIWLITARVKTIMFIGTILVTIILAIVRAFGGKKESFAAFDNVVDNVRAKVGEGVKKVLYL